VCPDAGVSSGLLGGGVLSVGGGLSVGKRVGALSVWEFPN
jgi:hypothetical protein